MNSSIQNNSLEKSLEEEARALIEKQEEFKGKILTERSSLLARVAELDELLLKLGGAKKRVVRQKVDGGGEGSVPLDEDGDLLEEKESQPSKSLDGRTITESYKLNPNLSKPDQILEIVRTKGPQTRAQITEMFPHASSAEKARTWTPMYQLVRSGRLVENKLGKLEIPKR
jgi:hypothetical protein